MKKLLSISYSDWAFDLTMFLLRIVFGALVLINHGFQKLMKFPSLHQKFSDPFHIGSDWSLILVIFAEVFCAILVIVGLFTRIAVLPLVITLGVAFFMAHNHDFKEGEKAAVYLTAFLGILFCGPGKYSADNLLGK